MDAQEIKNALCQSLTEVQESSGRPVPPFDGNFCPMGGLSGFDSFNAVEVAATLSDYLGCNITEDVALFHKHGRNQTIDEIVQDLYHLLNTEKGT